MKSWVLVVAIATLGACSSEEVVMSADATGSSTGLAFVDDSSSTGLEQSPDSSESSEGDDEPLIPPLEYARGIRMTRLTANQGVQVDLVRDGIEVSAEEQSARLIVGRRTLLRGFWSLHADFERRELVGQLTVDYPDGTTLEQDFVLMVESESSDGGASFQWLLEPDDIVSGMRFRVRVLEPDPSLTSLEVSDPPPILPLPDRGTMTFYERPLELKVVLVPVLHQFEGCEAVPEVTARDVEDLRHELEQSNPVQQAIFEVREPMLYTESIAAGPGFTPILAKLSQTRTDDGAADNVYYYGLLESCDGFPSGLLGQAFGIPDGPTRENAPQRVSVGRWNGSGAAAARTFVHEVGHSQGRRHVRCSGGEAGVDGNYPHPNGRIGVWGFGIHDFRLRTPTGGRDYMSYCSNRWVSDYGWELVLPIIETLTSWDADGVDVEPPKTMLWGVLYEDGTHEFWTGPGGLPSATTGEHTIVYDLGTAPITFPASIQPIPHGTAKLLIAPLPADPSAIASARLSPSDAPVRRIDPQIIDRRR